jgi:hypothetical protein
MSLSHTRDEDLRLRTITCCRRTRFFSLESRP